MVNNIFVEVSIIDQLLDEVFEGVAHILTVLTVLFNVVPMLWHLQ